MLKKYVIDLDTIWIVFSNLTGLWDSIAIAIDEMFYSPLGLVAGRHPNGETVKPVHVRGGLPKFSKDIIGFWFFRDHLLQENPITTT